MGSFCFLFEANQVFDCIQIKIVCVCVPIETKEVCLLT